MTNPLRILIILGSVREGRMAEPVGNWALEQAAAHPHIDAELVDLKEWNLPFYAFAKPPAAGGYTDPLQLKWAEKIAAADGYVLICPEYNHGPPAVLKNALDFVYAEWNRKPCTFVGYGGNGGARAVEILRQVVSNVELADVRAQVGLSLFTDFENFTTFKPGPHLEATVNGMLDQVIAWGGALKPLRTTTKSG